MSKSHNNFKIKLFTGLTFVIIATAVVFLTFSHKYFVVKIIDIKGNEKISDREVVKRSGIRAGYTSMFFLESRPEELISNNPWVSKVSIVKEFPDKVVIDISESEPFCLTADESDVPYYLTAEGKRIGRASPEYGMDFPIIRSEGKVKQNTLEEAVRLLKLSKSSSLLNWDEISEVRVNHDYGIRIITNDKRFIDFGKGNILSKWYKVEKIISHSRNIDLKEKYINVSSEKMSVINFNI